MAMILFSENNMPHLLSCIQQVEAIFDQCDREIAAFQKETGLHCMAHCSHCCDKKDIESSPLEFLPLAMHLMTLEEGCFSDYIGKSKHQKRAALQIFLDHLERRSLKASETCLFHKRSAQAWGCSVYFKRGLICRLFGFSARLNKQGQPEMITCSRIKTRFKARFNAAQDQIKAGLVIPIIQNYYMRLYAVEPRLATMRYPINLALYKAFEFIYLFESSLKIS